MMAGPRIWPLAIICIVFIGIIHAQEERCYLDMSELCFSNDLNCWAGDPQRFPGDPETLGNHFYLYTQSGVEEIMWDDVNSLDVFDAGRETVVIAHGFRSHYQDEYIAGIRTAFMDGSDINVIMVDWADAAEGVNYLQSRVDTRLVGRELGILLEELHDHRGLSYSDVHMVGHSLGAHLLGIAGTYLQGQIARITGLDPASPLYKEHTDIPGCVLDKTDAQFVDIIHSDGSLNLLGLRNATGHQDFYPNKGALWQTGCLFQFEGCGHMRSIDFFISSLLWLNDPSQGCDYPTSRCSWWQSCPTGGCPKMGIEASPVGIEPMSFCLSTSCYQWRPE